MNKQLKQIIKEEVYKVMMEIGEEDPMQLSQNMIKSDEDYIKELEIELKYRENDARVSGLPRDMRDARVAQAKVIKDRLEMKKKELEMSKQSEVNAVKFTQMQTQMQTQTDGNSQIDSQI
jgi:hypothetical protein